MDSRLQVVDHRPQHVQHHPIDKDITEAALLEYGCQLWLDCTEFLHMLGGVPSQRPDYQCRGRVHEEACHLRRKQEKSGGGGEVNGG